MRAWLEDYQTEVGVVIFVAAVIIVCSLGFNHLVIDPVRRETKSIEWQIEQVREERRFIRWQIEQVKNERLELNKSQHPDHNISGEMRNYVPLSADPLSSYGDWIEIDPGHWIHRTQY